MFIPALLQILASWLPQTSTLRAASLCAYLHPGPAVENVSPSRTALSNHCHHMCMKYEIPRRFDRQTLKHIIGPNRQTRNESSAGFPLATELRDEPVQGLLRTTYMASTLAIFVYTSLRMSTPRETIPCRLAVRVGRAEFTVLKKKYAR